MRYTINEIAGILQSPFNFELNYPIDHLLIDSRKLYFPASSLFFALEGMHTNGHLFVQAMYNQGVRCFIVKDNFAIPDLQDANFIQVSNPLVSLQQLASWHRRQFAFPVIGITGSNGKTIVKEMLYQLLYSRYKIVRSPKSYNSQIGVPLSVWQMQDSDELGIFEAGISRPDEMMQLQQMIDPGIGIFSFIGTAHDKGFKNLEQKIDEKLKLFTASKWLCYCNDDILLDEKIRKFQKNINPSITLFSWGNANADLLVKNISKQNQLTDIRFEYLQKEYAFSIPFTDDASVHNALTCVCVLLYLNLSRDEIAENMLQLKPIAMRLEMKQGINHTVIINDSYSSDINSLQIALDFLLQLSYPSNKTLVLSDILQSGEPEAVLYPHLAKMIGQKNLFRFVGIGSQLMAYKHLFSKIPNVHFYERTSEFLAALNDIDFHDETILLKGARIFSFERISRLLEQKQHQTILEIDLNALRHNLWAYKQKLQPGVMLMAMVKAFSYGSGTYEVAGILQHSAVDYLGVAYTDEAVELRNAGVRLPVMVMNFEEASFDSIVRYQLQPEIYSMRILKAFQHYLQVQAIMHYPVHIKLDTGMHRLGFELKDMDELLAAISGDSFKIVSVFSHLAGSDSNTLDQFSEQQFEVYNRMVGMLESTLKYPVIKHIANTSAISRLPHLQLDMVRLGIGLYGVDANEQMQVALKNVTTLKTTIAQIRHVKKGESVGYGRAAVLEKDSVVATVRIGYADGYSRMLGNGVGKMFINGKLAPVLGNICMDMTMLDVTDIEVREEDEVIVFGEALPVRTVAKWASTIPYEILTRISQRVKRLYYEE